MEGIGVLKSRCQGESHKISGKPCQDYCIAENKGKFAMAILSDGHGGSRYFRSDRGAQLAVKIAKQAIEQFIRISPIEGLINSKKDEFGVNTTINKETSRIFEPLKQLVSSIVTRWNDVITKDAKTNSLSDWELQNVEKKYLDEFENKVRNHINSFEKYYGCTLMAFVRTEKYWFTFQIGDGKIVFFNRDDERFLSNQPIPWDERCFLNQTTSICDSEAVSEFRFAFSGKGDFPLAVFLGSDGIDDTYGDGDKLTDFYIRLYKEMVLNSPRVVEKMLEEDLPYISKTGSKDDLSIALVYEKNKRFMDANYLLMSKWQIDNLTNRISNIDQRINELNQKVQKIGEDEDLSESQIMELSYTRKDLERAREEKRELESNISKIQSTDERFKEKRIKDQ